MNDRSHIKSIHITIFKGMFDKIDKMEKNGGIKKGDLINRLLKEYFDKKENVVNDLPIDVRSIDHEKIVTSIMVERGLKAIIKDKFPYISFSEFAREAIWDKLMKSKEIK